MSRKRASNVLFFGDNLDVLQRHVKDESVDLVYLDPPFKSNQDYNVLFAEHGTRSAAQIQAFEDTWRWDEVAAISYEATLAAGGQVAQAMRAFRTLLGTSDMLAYLSMMAPRLVELRRVLKPTGSIFLHCDPTAGHYLKVLMDAVFAPQNFRNEIAWCYFGPGSPHVRQFLRKHDTIYWYSMGKSWTFNRDAVRVPHSEKTRANYKAGLVGSGFADAPHLIHEKGKVPEDWWVIAIAPRGKEYLGYPTQKPIALLDRIIQAASNPGDVVLDPFCGCGTAIDVAQRRDRKWIGIDITYLAVNLIRHRLQDAYGEGVKSTYGVIGEPVTLDEAQELWREDHYQFQFWALSLVGARYVEQKRGADRGIDGRLLFQDADDETREIIFSVKGGRRVGVAAVRDLRGVVEREQAALGVFITLQTPTPQMRSEAASAGVYASANGTFYPRLQILTIEELFKKKTIQYPPTGPGVPRRPEVPEQLVLKPEQRRAASARPRTTPELVEDLLRRARTQSPPVRLEPILEQLGVELSARPGQKEDALLVQMAPASGDTPAAWMVYYNPDKPENRRRYTLAHEVGHVLLESGTWNLAAAARGGGGRFKQRERQMERFAAELLMPTRFVRDAVRTYGADAAQLAGLFRVSRQAMEIRLGELRLT